MLPTTITNVWMAAVTARGLVDHQIPITRKLVGHRRNTYDAIHQQQGL